MTEQRQAFGKAEARRFDQYLAAEEAVWERYGLHPVETYVDVGPNQVVRVHDVGAGEPILFVHGSGGAGVYWAPLAVELAGDFRCILMDRPGWTRSTPIDYTRADFATIAATLLADLLASLGVDKAHVVGGSIGDLFALRLAQLHPDRAGKLVLLGGGPLTSAVEPPTFVRLLRSPLGRIMIHVPPRRAMVRKQMEGLGHEKSLDRGLIPSELVDVYSATARYTDAMRHERDLVRSILTSRGFVRGLALSEDDMAAVAAPTLMVYGDHDPTGSTDIWQHFAAGLPDGTLHVVPDSGHLVWYDAPDTVGALIRDHLVSPSMRPT